MATEKDRRPFAPGTRVPLPREVTAAPWDQYAASPELQRAVRQMGDHLRPAPAAPVDPSPAEVAVFRASLSLARRVLPWLAPVVLSITGAGVGYAKGYFEGLADAGARMARGEEATKINAESIARVEARITGLAGDRDEAFAMLRDHDVRIPRVERAVAAIKR